MSPDHWSIEIMQILSLDVKIRDDLINQGWTPLVPFVIKFILSVAMALTIVCIMMFIIGLVGIATSAAIIDWSSMISNINQNGYFNPLQIAPIPGFSTAWSFYNPAMWFLLFYGNLIVFLYCTIGYVVYRCIKLIPDQWSPRIYYKK